MFLSNISIKRPVMISMLLIVFLIFGLLAFFELPIDLFPEINIPYVTVQTVYPGAGPQEIETLITKKIEDAVGTISKIDTIESFSLEGASIVLISFDLGKDPDIANQEVKDKVGAIIAELPSDAEQPTIEKLEIGVESIIDVLFTGDMDMRELYQIADTRLKDRLSQVDGVARVNVLGGEEREIRVELDNRMVFQNKISLSQLAQILAVQNLDMPGGFFEEGSQEYSVRFKGEFNSVQTIAQLDIPTVYGTKKLGQIAEIKDSSAEVRERTIFFDNINKIKNERMVLLSIVKSPDGNTVKIAKDIKKALPSIQREMPPGTRLSLVKDDSIFIESSVNDTFMNIVLGVFLTAGILLFFLHDLRSTLIAALAMPMSIISTFMVMRISGFTFNILTLMGLSTSVGILVTNSVVVLENIFRHREMGHNRKLAADRGTSEIATAVLASTLTNVAVFLPIATMGGVAGIFFKEFALTVTYATFFSLLISFTLTPMMASLILPEHDTKKHPVGKRLEGMFRAFERRYQLVLRGLLERKLRGVMVIVGVVILFVFSLFIAGQIGFEFMPAFDQGDINIAVELPQGYNLQETAALVDSIEERIKNHEEVRHILTTLGSTGELDKGANLARMWVKLVDVSERELSSKQAESLFIRQLSDIPNARITVSAVSHSAEGGSPIQFYIAGQDNEQLEHHKNEILSSIRDVEGLINLDTSSRTGKPEITLVPDRRKIAEAGLTVYDLAFTLRSAVDGVVATQYKEAGNEYDVRVVLTEESVDTPEEVGNVVVTSTNGTYRLAHFADIQFSEGYSKILHRDKFKTIQFTGSPAPGYPLGDVVGGIRAKLSNIQLPEGYKITWGGEAEMMEETMLDMLRAILIAILLTYMLLSAILENLFQPLLILGTFPLALIGVFLALFVTGTTMNIASMMAIIMLLGIVVNNAILLLDYTNQLRRGGSSIRNALLEACPTKLKPILMSNAAIILGMFPMAVGFGSAGREMRMPLGIVSIGGLIMSAVLTLIIIPTIYNLTGKEIKASQ
jgi:HAE1 family hydrophobic/amphiphilic exporter-1